MSANESGNETAGMRDSQEPGERSGGAGHAAVNSAESREREAALQRAREGRQRHPLRGQSPSELANLAFASLAENVRDFAIFLMDPSGVITLWGHSARRIKGWTKVEAEGAHLRLLYPDHGSEDGTAEEHLREAAENGEYMGEGHRWRKDGTSFWAGVSLTALRDPDGELIGFAKVTRDLTARREEEAMLKGAIEEAEEARIRAEEANQSKMQFLATMSHEIRTPINAVMGYADLLHAEIAGPLTADQQRYLSRVRASNLHLLGIIDEVLDFSRMEANRISLDSGVGRLSEPLRAALQMVQLQAGEKGVEISDGNAETVTDASYLGDEDRVRQVLVVLLSNAVKFTPRGGRVTVTTGAVDELPADVKLNGEGPWIYVRIEDTGPGIPSERIEAIFDPFEQADMSLTRKHGGTGLGLTIARRLALLMNGDLSVRSTPGLGSSFFVWLPAASDEEVRQTEGSVAPRAALERPALLDEVRDAVLLELERILHAFVARLKADPQAPGAAAQSEAELQDHLATFLSDLADTFRSLDLGTAESDHAIRDSTAIQRTVAERHGAQRCRLGWSEGELRREYQILREEVAAAIARQVTQRSPEEMAAAVAAVSSFIAEAEKVSLESFRSYRLSLADG
jgi:PAS domain S-box-containing protein